MSKEYTFPIDPLLKMAIGHYQFEAIHPFRDGNGQTGCIFNINYLTKKGLLDYPILFLSKFIIDHKEDYYSGLAGITQTGNWKTWLMYMMKAVEATSNITYDKINDILSAKDAILSAIETDTDIQRPDQLVNAIFTQPFTKVPHLVDSRTYAENTARRYLERLVGMGVLERREVSKGFYYLNLELYRILSV